MVEVFMSSLFMVDEQSIGLWFPGIVLSQLSEAEYQVRVDTDSADGALIERPFHEAHMRPITVQSTTASFDYHDNLLTYYHEEAEAAVVRSDPTVPHRAVSRDDLTPKMLPQRPKTAPDMRRLNPRMIGSSATIGKQSTYHGCTIASIPAPNIISSPMDHASSSA